MGYNRREAKSLLHVDHQPLGMQPRRCPAFEPPCVGLSGLSLMPAVTNPAPCASTISPQARWSSAEVVLCKFASVLVFFLSEISSFRGPV